MLPYMIFLGHRPLQKKLEMRTRIKEKSLTPAGFEPMTS